MRAELLVGTLALVAVGEQQHDRAALAPLLLGAADELVDDRLRPVAEVTELRLPQHERVGPFDGVAVLEAHRGVLRQQRVVDPEARLALAEIEQWRPLLRVVLVDEHGVTLHERAAAAVLTSEADRRALLEEGAEGEQLGHRPVDAALVHHLGPTVHQLLELRVDGEALGRAREGLPDVDELTLRDTRLGG